MTVSEVIDRLIELREQHGEQAVLIDAGCSDCGLDGLLDIDEIDLDVDDNGFIIWPAGVGA